MTATIRSVRSAYRTTAVVDWIELEIQVVRPTQFQWLQRVLANHYGGDTRAYIEAVDAGAGNKATRFLIRLNDTCCRNVDTICAALAALDRQYTLVGAAVVKALEVSLDFYPNDDQAHANLLKLVARLQMSLEARGGTSHRQVGSSKRPDFLDSTRTSDPHQTLYINNMRDPVSWRIYHKITDRNRDLPHDQHRARVEFTLKGTGLHKYGIHSLDDLAVLDFCKFRELLQFRQFKPMSELVAGQAPALARLLQRATRRDRNLIALYPFGQHAYRRDNRTGKPRNRGLPKERKHSTHTAADAELNRIVHDRLHDLTQVFHTKFSAKTRSRPRFS